MKKYILKNSADRYFTISNGNHTTTARLELAYQYEHDRAMNRALAFNRDHEDNMKMVPYDQEVLVYYPHVAYHATDQADAQQYLRKLINYEMDGQFTSGAVVHMQGLWFVYGRKEEVPV